MDTIECINSKRSIRAYEETQIPYETVMELLTLGTKASTGSNHQPWGFVVIQDAREIEDLSKKLKEISDEAVLNQMIEKAGGVERRGLPITPPTAPPTAPAPAIIIFM